jgi:hypothetical protein
MSWAGGRAGEESLKGRDIGSSSARRRLAGP